MHAGLAIAASDCKLAEGGERYFNPFREIAGDAAEYFNPFDEEAIFAVMQRLLNDPSLRTDLARRARLRSTQFSFQETARGTADVFHAVAEGIESAKKSRAMDARLS